MFLLESIYISSSLSIFFFRSWSPDEFQRIIIISNIALFGTFSSVFVSERSEFVVTAD
jgi:hypothetical protein